MQEIQIHKIDQFFDSKPSNIKGALLYGTDEGLMLIARRQIVSKLSQKWSYNPSVIEHDYKNVKDNSQILYDDAASYSLFESNTKIIFIKNCSDAISPTLLGTLQALAALDCFTLLTAEIKKTSKTFLALGKLPHIAFIPCYLPEKAHIEALIRKIFAEQYVNYESAVPRALAELLPHYSLAIQNEIQKLLVYKLASSEEQYQAISLTDVEKVFLNESEISADELSIGFLLKEKEAVHRCLTSSKAKEINLIAVTRTIQNYLLKIIQIQSYMNSGLKAEQAVARVKPPIFWKYRAAIIKLANTITLSDIRNLSSRLISLETKYKNLSIPSHILLSYFLVKFL